MTESDGGEVGGLKVTKSDGGEVVGLKSQNYK